MSGYEWVEEFRRRNGRAPRVLHLGNIANNAYLNAKLLIKEGIDCDVLCHDYYHIMGCPEWEDADFDDGYGDQNRPDWSRAGIKAFERPRWFVQGPLQFCIDYLVARNEGRMADADRIWARLCDVNGTGSAQSKVAVLTFALKAKRIALVVFAAQDLASRVAAYFDNRRESALLKSEEARLFFSGIAAVAVAVVRIAAFPVLLYVGIKRAVRLILTKAELSSRIAVYFDTRRDKALLQIQEVRLIVAGLFTLAVGVLRLVMSPFRYLVGQDIGPFEERMAVLETQFTASFPVRSSRRISDDLKPFKYQFDTWSRLFRDYDLVHAYATSPLFPMLTGNRYVAYEHGTLRNIPFEESAQGRLCALSYRLSEWTVITNADNMTSARTLQIPRYSFVPHPVSERGMRDAALGVQVRKDIVAKLATDFIVLHPSRQHWSADRHPDWDKGNDVFLSGFARFVKEVNASASAVLVEWGASVDSSKKLIEQLGIVDRILWVPPMPHIRMMEYIHASDVVADQFTLGSFGGIPPKALGCGKPVMLFFNESIHRECFAELPPLISTRTDDEVFRALSMLSADRQATAGGRDSRRDWYERHHSNEAVTGKLMSVYSQVIASEAR